MKPVRLTMQAFGPFAEREIIDFRPAIDAGLFGIYGQTGSGKSTIFSAMTFGLFGEPTKIDQESPSLRSDHADAGTQTEVEFVFDISGRRFVVVRRPDQMRPKQRGGGETRSMHEAFLFDATGLALDDIREGHRGKILAEKKVRDVDMAIADLLGYGPEQFRQIVLLPQGRFEMFLAAKTKERLAILRELFDVSLYGALMGKLKADADAAEREVREERAVCAKRLSAEGFESTDALAGGIAHAEENYTAAQGAAQASQTAFEAAQRELQTSQNIEAQFKTAENTSEALAALEAGKGRMDALAGRVLMAEQARSLIDVEGNVTEAKLAVSEAGSRLDQARKTADSAVAKDQAAANALKSEVARVTETDALRRQIEEFDRHNATIQKASGVSRALAAAQESERVAAEKLDHARQRLTISQGDRHKKSEALKAAEKAEKSRQAIALRLATLKSEISASDAFEKAQKGVQAAQASVVSIGAKHKTAANGTKKAQKAFSEAEQNLSTAQALHLASKLVAGEPCSVCGATKHPKPATGAIENAGREQAFREAKAAWEQADDLARTAEQALSGAQSVLREREDLLAGLDRPERTSAVLAATADAERQALNALGPKIDIAKAEAEIAQLDKGITNLEKPRETLQNELSERAKVTASETARLKELLTAVPESLRDGPTLAAARETAQQSLAARQAAKEKAEREAVAAHDAAIAARKDHGAAGDVVTSVQDRHLKTVEIFQARLTQSGLSDTDFRALKPAIATIDQDRATVEGYRRKLENAREAVESAVEAIKEMARPDLTAVIEKQAEAEAALNQARNARAGAWHHLDHLAKLRDSLADILRRLDEIEVASGSLRELASLVNGANSHRLDLETFAIGAMFDHVLEVANLRLGPMTAGRYRMQRDQESSGRGRQGLGIEVFDTHTGKSRPTATLSGGETFIAALSLALGLADIVESASGKVRLDTIFIDEGFGSLDTENGSGTLDKVLEVLNSLVSQNRAVGLISHVPLVQEAIPNGFYVRKHPAGSRVETRGLV
jgi:exonuclease SbcC